jgi:hypothetical protein
MHFLLFVHTFPPSQNARSTIVRTYTLYTNMQVWTQAMLEANDHTLFLALPYKDTHGLKACIHTYTTYTDAGPAPSHAGGQGPPSVRAQ